jgi:hypothetical protein
VFQWLHKRFDSTTISTAVKQTNIWKVEINFSGFDIDLDIFTTATIRNYEASPGEVVIPGDYIQKWKNLEQVKDEDQRKRFSTFLTEIQRKHEMTKLDLTSSKWCK